eukprot:2962324-Prymnesium_polylepis.1
MVAEDTEDKAGGGVESVWLIATVVTMLLEMAALLKATQLSIWAPSLALRGPEGSVYKALGVMRVQENETSRSKPRLRSHSRSPFRHRARSSRSFC